MPQDEEKLSRARAELTDWIERNLDVLLDSDIADIELPVVDDFALVIGVSNAASSPGEGFTYFGRLSSGHAVYRTEGLMRAGARSWAVYPHSSDEDDD